MGQLSILNKEYFKNYMVKSCKEIGVRAIIEGMQEQATRFSSQLLQSMYTIHTGLHTGTHARTHSILSTAKLHLLNQSCTYT